MTKQQKTVTLRCDCNCAMFVIDKTVYADGDTDYSIQVQDSRYDHNHNTVWGRIKIALKILFGKPVYYSDVYIGEPEKFINFVSELSKLIDDEVVVQVEDGEE